MTTAQTTKKKKRRLKKEVIWALHGMFFIAVAIITASRVFAAPLRAEYVVGVGASMPNASVFVTRDTGEVDYATEEEIAAFCKRHHVEAAPQANTATLGVHTVYLKYDKKIYTATLVVEDAEPPVIVCDAEDTVFCGESYAFKRHVSATDNYSANVSLVVDSSAVDLNTPGDYAISYHAMDMAGNVADATSVLHVVEKEEPPLSEEEIVLNAYADAVLEEITTDEMSLYEKARAIYEWTHEIEYIHIVEEQSFFENAAQGFTERRGDCHVYAATARTLLERIGVECIDIVNIPPSVAHAWNLINLGEGWRHFDATKRYQDADLFYLTDEELMAYSTTHDYTHRYDASLYPAIE